MAQQNALPVRRCKVCFGRLYVLHKVMGAARVLNLLLRSLVVQMRHRDTYVGFKCRF